MSAAKFESAKARARAATQCTIALYGAQLHCLVHNRTAQLLQFSQVVRNSHIYALQNYVYEESDVMSATKFESAKARAGTYWTEHNCTS